MTAMQNVIPIHRKRRIEEQAAAWVVRVDSDDLCDDEKARLQAWLAEDADHAAAFEYLAQTWKQVDCLALLAQVIPLQQNPSPEPPRKTWAPWQWAAPLGLVGVLLVAVLTVTKPDFLPWLAAHKVVESVYQTRTGEQSQVLLGDGSKLVLNTRSEVRVHIDARERSVYLNTGEVYFDVAPDPRVPFVVYAGKGVVRAVGTSFNVRIRDEDVEVAVAEGVVGVSVARPDSTKSNAQALRAGDFTRYAERIETRRRLSEAQLDRRVAWKGGKWAFDGQTLAEVVKDVGRYTNQRLEIVDPAIARIRIGGYFDIGDIEPFLEALDTGFGIKHRRIADDLIVLSLHESPDGTAH
ncbi:MAG: FecR domain-containing protein [Pseudomonadales bacterium]|nr:FecR domain-containing protein [Pseudomonadales bacterium]